MRSPTGRPSARSSGSSWGSTSESPAHTKPTGDPDQQRQGSFGNVDRVVIVTYDDAAERARVTGLRGVRRLLRRAPLGDDAVARAVNELHTGRAVVLVDFREIAAGEARDQLEQLARAA
jgi:hypothetical protein